MKTLIIPKSLAKMIMTKSHGTSLLVDVAEHPWDYEGVTGGGGVKPKSVTLAKVRYQNRKIYSLYIDRSINQCVVTVNEK